MEERVASLEGRMESQERRIDDVRDAIVGLGKRIDSLEGRMNARFVGLEQRMTSLEGRLDARFTSLEEIGQRQFHWLLGTQVTTLAAVVGAMAAIIVAFAGR
jgi:uncharacterized coiled-coil protein SlyX